MEIYKIVTLTTVAIGYDMGIYIVEAIDKDRDSYNIDIKYNDGENI